MVEDPAGGSLSGHYKMVREKRITELHKKVDEISITDTFNALQDVKETLKDILDIIQEIDKK